MKALRRFCVRLIGHFTRHRDEQRLREELEGHLALQTAENMRAGMAPDEARRRAILKFGAVEALKEEYREKRSLPSVDALFYDLRFALRGLARDRGVAAASITMLALAIGLNVTVFTVANAMLFRGFPLVARNDRLLYLQERAPSASCCVSYADFEDWRAQSRTFQGMAFVASNRPITLRDSSGRPADKLTFQVSANTFALLGVVPLLGRDFVPEDEMPGAAQVVLLNHRFWESRYAMRPDIVGSTVHINGAPATIIGVMPPGFDFPTQEDLWMPITRSPGLLQRGFTPGGFMVVGRLRDSVSQRQATAELETINRRLEASYPATNRGVVPTAATHSETMSGGNATVIWGSLWVGACFVFLIACANLANLSLVRTVRRWREFSTRIALGAGHARTSRQILLESVTIAGIAGAIGWCIASWGLRRWTIVTASRYQVLNYSLDATTLAYLVAISVVAALLLSAAPMIRVIQLDVSGALKGDGRGISQGRLGKQLAAGLIAGQMALAIVLLSGAGVLVRSFVKIVGADTGVRDPEKVLVGLLRLPSDKYSTGDMRHGYFTRLEEQLRSIPGIERAAVANVLPVSYAFPRPMEMEGRPGVPEGEGSVAFVRVGLDYFNVIGAPPILGRGFNESDHAASLPVAVVNESFAARFLPGEQPVGRRIRAAMPGPQGEWRTVVGVVPNILQGEPLRQQFKPLVYIPFRQEPVSRVGFFLLRMAVPPDQVAQAVRAEVQRLDPDVGVEDLETLRASFAFDRDFMDAEHSELGKHATIAPVFALIALPLAAIGLSAVIAHSVSQRTKEIGVRMAIGAAATDVTRQIVSEGMMPVGIGTILGLAASLGVNRILQSQLVGVSPYDPVTLSLATAVLIGVALAACQIPARRAARVDPLVALRYE
jgi:putative ABC transport system permease protein